MAAEDDREDAPRRAPAIPGMTVNEDAVIPGDAPDEDLADDADGPFDEEDGPLAVKDDDTIGADEADDDEREQGATEAGR